MDASTNPFLDAVASAPAKKKTGREGEGIDPNIVQAIAIKVMAQDPARYGIDAVYLPGVMAVAEDQVSNKGYALKKAVAQYVVRWHADFSFGTDSKGRTLGPSSAKVTTDPAAPFHYGVQVLPQPADKPPAAAVTTAVPADPTQDPSQAQDPPPTPIVVEDLAATQAGA